MLNQSRKELKAIARIRGIKCYKSMSEDRLLSALKASESLKESEKNFDKLKIEEIRKKINEFRYKFPKSEINEIKKNLHEIEIKKNLFASKI